MHFIFNRYRRYQQIQQSRIIFSLPLFFPHSKFVPNVLSDLIDTTEFSANDQIHVTNDDRFWKLFYSMILHLLSSSQNIPIDLLMLHKDERHIRNMNVCKHLSYHLMKKETFHYQHGNINVLFVLFHSFVMHFVFRRFSLSRWYFCY